MSDSKKDTINISIDCLGGDNYPNAQIEGIKFFLKRNKNTNDNIKFLLYGEKDILESGLKRLSIPEKYYEIINVTKRVRSDEKPSIAMRNGKDSSMWLAIEAVKQGIANASISAGNTGALMAISMLLLRTLQDVDRPALIQMLPTERNSSVAMLDMGANIDCSSNNLYQFAVMGKIFYEAITGNENPTIGLLNVGSEEMKGNDVVKSAAFILKNSILKEDFYGFVEGNDILKGTVDIVVTDGFTGNVALKTIEGTAKFLSKNLKDLFTKSIFNKFIALLLSKSLKSFKSKISPENYNGAMFLGLNGISVKSHGNANGKSFCFAIENTIKLVKSNINEKIINMLIIEG